jgi:hypothetical protein
MTTRTIVTSQPDVACDVCERRLLRGEQPDVFLAAGRRLTVCELCAPRAAHEGWMRESDAPAVTLPPPRGRRGRSLLDRLRQVGRPPEEQAAGEPFDFLRAHDEPRPVPARRPSDQLADDAGHDGPAPFAVDPGLLSFDAQALNVFNASEFPRRIAGVARSLGPPEVSVASAEHLESVVRITVAWELSWYRYEVDLSEPGAVAEVIGQGTELSELGREERLANAAADDAGMLSLAA